MKHLGRALRIRKQTNEEISFRTQFFNSQPIILDRRPSRDDGFFYVVGEQQKSNKAERGQPEPSLSLLYV